MTGSFVVCLWEPSVNKKKEEEGNRPLVKPQRVTAGSTWFRPRPLRPLRRTSVPSSWHQLWHHNVYGCYTWNTSKPRPLPTRERPQATIQHVNDTNWVFLFVFLFVCLFEEINASSEINDSTILQLVFAPLSIGSYHEGDSITKCIQAALSR